MYTYQTMIENVVTQLEAQSFNSLAAGFSFASAIAWMDVVRAIVAMVVSNNRQTPGSLTITAVITTLLSILAFMIISRVSRAPIKQPGQTLYAVSR